MNATAPPLPAPPAASAARPWLLRFGGVHLAVVAMLAVVVLWLLGPLVWMLVTTPPINPVSDAHEGARLSGLWWVTVRIALYATLLATLFGVLTARAINASRGWMRRVLAACFPVSLLLPPTVVAVAWTHLLGRRGILNDLGVPLFGQRDFAFSIYGEFGAAWIMALSWFPLVTLSTLVGLRANRSRVQRAGLLYAGWWRRGVYLEAPLLAPYVSAGAVFVAWLALGDFEIAPVLLLNTYTLQIYAAVKLYKLGEALYLSGALVAVALSLLAVRHVLLRSAYMAGQDQRWSPQAMDAAHRVAGERTTVLVGTCILLLSVAAPLASLAHQAGTWSRIVEGLATARNEIFNSFAAALVAAVGLLAVGLMLAMLLRRLSGWPRLGLSLLILIPLAVPGTVLGLAWTGGLSHSAWGRELLAWTAVCPVGEARAQWAPVVSLVTAARALPVVSFLLAAVWASLHPGLLRAAASSGAGPGRRGIHIALPLLYPGLLAAFALAFALCVGELNASILIAPVGCSLLPIRLSSLLHFGKDELLAALCLIQVFLALVPYLAAAALLERSLEARLG